LRRLFGRFRVDQRDFQRRPAVGQRARVEHVELQREQQAVDRQRRTSA